MSSCLVCAATAAVYCEQDNAYLCKKCDQTIHGHNVLAQRHVRRPLCDLCHRSVAAVWCKEDAAYLCSGCDVEVHAANPIPHDRVAVTPIGASCAEACCPSSQLPAAPLSASAAAAAAADAPPMEDSNSACGKADALRLPQKEGSCEVRSAAVVPEMPQQQVEDSATAPGAAPSSGASLLTKAPSLPKGFDFLDLDNSWLDRLDTGFDFSDIFNTAGDVPASADGLVPTLSDNNNPSSSHELLCHGSSNAGAVHSTPDDNDLMVPFSLSLPDELPLPQLGSLKRVASDEALVPPPSKQQCNGHQNTPFQLKQEQQASMTTPMMVAPQWQTVPTPVPVPQPPPKQQPATQPGNHSVHHASQPAIGLASGAELTREQRVARYREKRKNRKFEKTIRYASRKAYAEVRPRIKGRFATREEVIALKAQKAQQEAQQQFQLQLVDDDCVVPNFI